MFRFSKEFIRFLLALMFTKEFWMLLLASFTTVLMLAWRGSIRDQIFKMAQKTVGRRW